jgi:hypothetical protein
MAVYEYETASGPVGAFYQILNNNRYDGYFERFMGNGGTLITSEAARRTMIYPEAMNSDIRTWARLVKEGHLVGPKDIMDRIDELTVDQLWVLFVDETPPPVRPLGFELPVKMTKPHHQPHLENFFDAIRGRATLNCPAEAGYAAALSVLKVNEAIEAERKLKFQPEDFKA